MTTRLVLIISCLVFKATLGWSQQSYCGTDVWRNQLSQNNPASKLDEELFDRRVYNLLNNDSEKISGTLIIPVVFHIMHNNGPENISDSVVFAAVDELNQRFQNAGTFYDSTGNSVGIQFCLATVDPQGNPTNGITRTITSFTNLVFPTGDQSLKNLSRWSPDLYYNIWSVAHISGPVDGYSSLPWSAGQSVDGVVVEYLYLTNSYLLAHETAHYCGLYHTFENLSCTNFNCMLNGDQVCDTPPDNSYIGFPCMTNSCTTELQDTSGFNPFTADVNELPNYMDYTTCPLSFTQGQAARMEAAVVASRSGLLQSNGCGNNPGQPLPIAGFVFEVSSCNNGQVTFSDSLSVNSVTSEWDFNSDGMYDTLAHNFVFTFPATGSYTVTQRVTGIGGQDTISHQLFVYKGGSYNYPIVAYPQAVTDTMRICQGAMVTFDGASGGVSYLWSTGDTTGSISFIADSSMDISLVMIDSNGFSWSSQCTPLYLLVYPFNTPVITYDDPLGYLCSDTSVTVYIANPIPGVYTWQVYYNSIGWFNTGNHDSSYTMYADPTYGNQFYVTYINAAGCSSQSNYLLVQPQSMPFITNTPLTVNGYTLSAPVSGFQFQWYNNNIAIPGAVGSQFTVTQTGCYNLAAWSAQYPACVSLTDTVCYLFSGIEGVNNNDFIIYPNPASNVLRINSLLGNTDFSSIIFIDSKGREIVIKDDKVLRMGQEREIDISGFKNGLYLVRINCGAQTYSYKIVKIE